LKKITILADFPIQFLAPFLSPRDPGQHYATWLPQLAEAFEGQNEFEISWIVLSKKTDQERIVRQWNQSFYLVPTAQKFRIKGFYKNDRANLARLIKIIQPELVHGWGAEDINGWAAVFSGRPNIYSCQGLLSLYVLKSVMHPKMYLQALMEILILNKAQTITTESEWAKQKIQHRTIGKDIRVIEYGVSPRFFREKNSPNPDQPYALFVGHADYRKGIDVALGLFERPELRKYKLKICGKIPPETEAYRRGGAANIEWLGRKSEEETVQLMKNATFMILPTRADTGPTVAKEARVMGLPVIASPHGGHIGYIFSGETGFILPLRQTHAWVSSCLKMFADKKARDEMSNRHLEADRNKLDPRETARGFLGLYREKLAHQA